ncbi:methionine synthase [Ruminococcaceae bacterium OttesenSCG-928-I18]|nr:methionine synthase [Ruminococcaceae bacterium OttesenSCG-928-I18]
MQFKNVLPVDRAGVLSALGYRGLPADEQTEAKLTAACHAVQQAAKPRFLYASFPLGAGLRLGTSETTLTGRDIAAHLAGCSSVLLLALTLGQRPEAAIRKAEATSVELAVLMDTAASTLAEQYANEAERQLRQQTETQGQFLTGRFSPGYGDLPIELQRDLLRLLDGPRAIGLSVSQSGILLPRKSITALLGIADHPVEGKLAGCDHCILFENCVQRKEGNYCGKPSL